MLDQIRQNASSWGVKIAFGLIITVFVFWGVGSMNSTPSGSVVATVNENPVLANEFIRAYQQQYEAMKRRLPGLKDEDLAKFGFKKSVLNNLIVEKLVLAEAEKLGVSVTPQELKQHIAGFPVFHNEKGGFDGDKYQQVLAAQGMNPGEFESSVRKEMLFRKMEEYIGMPASVTAEEAHDVFAFRNERRSVEFVQMAAAEFMQKAVVTDEQVASFYEENTTRFEIPQKMAIDYMLITPAALARTIPVDEAEIAAFYDENAETYFVQEEQVHARHILVQVKADASDEDVKAAEKKIARIQREIKRGKKFADLAKKYSEGPSAAAGGDLGSLSRGVTVPEFEKAAFALKSGQISAPVRTSFGFHIIKVEEHTPSRVKSLAEVHDEIKKRLGEDKAADKVGDTLDTALETLVSGKPLANVAEELGLEIRSSPEFSRDRAQAITGLNASSLDTLFAMEQGMVTDTPLEVENGYMLAFVRSNVPSSVRSLESVASRIKVVLQQKEAMKLVMEEAKKLADDIEEKGMPKKLTKTMQSTPLFDRRGFVPGIGQNPEMVKAVFAGDSNTWVGPFAGNGAAIFARVKDVQKPSDEEWEKAKEEVMQAILQGRKRELFQTFIADVRDKAEIKVLNSKLLEEQQ